MGVESSSLQSHQEDTDRKKEVYSVRCHCGKVRGRFKANKKHVVAWDCNCSDCSMRGNVHIVIPQEDFRVDMPEYKSYQVATTEYLWGTKTAKRRFCRTCGILPWYRPRSNPDGYAITLKCIDWGDDEAKKPKIESKTFDGENWEQQFAESEISKYSKIARNQLG
mmetsp:Transcript_9639/g.18952  ORF Transcript_9639/g.18952 Transcript_9639/m.18952 type:complete len:165 (+) Transcript_9639:18-512(+)